MSIPVLRFDGVVKACQEAVFADGGGLSDTVPSHLTRAYSALRAKNPASAAEAQQLLRKQQDVKDTFWQMVDKQKLRLRPKNVTAIKDLMASAA